MIYDFICDFIYKQNANKSKVRNKNMKKKEQNRKKQIKFNKSLYIQSNKKKIEISTCVKTSNQTRISIKYIAVLDTRVNVPFFCYYCISNSNRKAKQKNRM